MIKSAILGVHVSTFFSNAKLYGYTYFPWHQVPSMCPHGSQFDTSCKGRTMSVSSRLLCSAEAIVDRGCLSGTLSMSHHWLGHQCFLFALSVGLTLSLILAFCTHSHSVRYLASKTAVFKPRPTPSTSRKHLYPTPTDSAPQSRPQSTPHTLFLTASHIPARLSCFPRPC